MLKENYYQTLGALVLGSRLRKLSDRLLAEVGNIYKQRNLDFEPGWFHIMYLLNEFDRLSVTEISEILQISHPSVIQSIGVMEAKGIIELSKDKKDKRKRIIELSETGKKLLVEIQPVWARINVMMNDFLAEGEHSKNLLKAVSEIETQLDRKNLSDRLK